MKKTARNHFFLTMLSLSLLLSCSGNNENKRFTIHFDTNTEYATNTVLDQNIRYGKHVKQPTLVNTDDDKQNYVVYGWYLEKEAETAWNFRKDRVYSSMTLYAKWGYQYDVTYYISGEEEPYSSVTLKEGEKAEEHPEYVIGFDYLGSFSDKDCTVPFDFDQGIHQDTDIYIRRSEGISISEESVSGALSENLEAYAAGSDAENGIYAKAGYAEPRTLDDGHTYTYVNYGYSPYNDDPYVELALPLDIRNSQLLTFSFKNLGPAYRFIVYFLAYADDAASTYSATGKGYKEKFSARIELDESLRNMDAEGDWADVTLDLSAPCEYGYSVWGCAPLMASLRIQACYQSQDKNDLSNEFLFRSITGSSKNITVTDSDTVTPLLHDDSEEDLEKASESEEDVNGFVFPKDRQYVSAGEDASIYMKEDGALLYTDNEIALKQENSSYLTSKITIALPLDGNYQPTEKQIDLSENPTLNISLRNYGFRNQLSFYIYNNEGDCVTTSITIGTRMNEYTTYFLNLFKDSSMYGYLTRIEIFYSALGVNNAISIHSLYFSEFKALDTVGINFNDKFTYGMSGNDDVAVEYDSRFSATKFTVTNTGAAISSTRDYACTNAGYRSASLVYYVPEDSGVSEVTVSYLVNGHYASYVHSLEDEKKGVRRAVSSVDFVPDERGDITGLKLEFRGTGIIEINAISFVLDDTSSVDFGQNISNYTYADWIGNCQYLYDTTSSASLIIPEDGMTCTLRSYLAVGHHDFGGTVYPAENISLADKSVIRVIYQNRSHSSSLSLSVGVDTTVDGSSDKKTGTQVSLEPVMISTEMDYYEWQVADFALPEEYHDQYLAKTVVLFSGTSIYLRAIVVE